MGLKQAANYIRNNIAFLIGMLVIFIVTIAIILNTIDLVSQWKRSMLEHDHIMNNILSINNTYYELVFNDGVEYWKQVNY